MIMEEDADWMVAFLNTEYTMYIEIFLYMHCTYTNFLPTFFTYIIWQIATVRVMTSTLTVAICHIIYVIKSTCYVKRHMLQVMYEIV